MTEMDTPHEMILSFLEQKDPEIRKKYNEYKKEQLNPFPEVSRTSLDKQQNNALFPLLLKAEISLHHASDRRPNAISSEAYNAMGFCFFLQILEDVNIVDPTGKTLSKNIVDLYGEDIVNDFASFWDVYFEMEVAHKFVLEELDASPIDESAVAGPGSDVFYRAEDRDFWVECKNKRETTSYGWELERFGREIADSLWLDYDLEDDVGEDSFAVRVSSRDDISEKVIENSSFRERVIKEVAGELAELIKQRNSKAEVEIADANFEVELINYYSGRHSVTLSEEQMDAVKKRANLAKVINPYGHLGINPDILDTDGHGTVYAENAGDNEIEIFSTYAFLLDIPWENPYDSWIFSTIDGVTDQFPDYPDIIIFVKIPPGFVYQMMREKTVNHRDERVSKWERLKEKIIGIYANPDRENRVKAVVLMTDVVMDEVTEEGRNVMLQSAVEAVYNENVEDQIPAEFIDLIDGQNQIQEVFSRPGQLNLKDQHL